MARNPTLQQIEAVEALLAGAEKQIREAFLAAVYAARGRVDLGALIDALERRDIEATIEMLRFDQSLLWPLEEAVRGTFLQGGASVAGSLPAGLQGRFGFNGRHPRAEAEIARIGADLVVTIEREQNEAIRTVILDAAERNRPSGETALDIIGRVVRIGPEKGQRTGGIVGLSEPQTQRYLSVQRLMETPEGVQDLVVKKDGKLTVRYKVNLATKQRILRAYKAGTAVPAPDRTISNREYKNKLLQERGQLIAQNEAHVAQAAGRHEAYQQMAERDDVEAVTVKWIHGFSRDFRPDHLRMNGEVRRLGEGFVMDDGVVMMHPHDPAGGVKHSAFCRCTAFYRAIPRRV